MIANLLLIVLYPIFMPNYANDPSRTSWLEVPENSDFPIQNIPFGVFITKDDVITIGTRIGNYAIDMGPCSSWVILKESINR